MKKTTITQTALALLTAGYITASVAGEDRFINLDTNEDGYISAEEAKAAGDEKLQNTWKATDRNMDGQIDAAEFSAFEAAVSESSASE